MNICTIAMAFGMVLIVMGMSVMLLDFMSAARGELVFFAGLAILLSGVIGAARKD